MPLVASLKLREKKTTNTASRLEPNAKFYENDQGRLSL